jgi:hypothetical protein
MKYELSEQENNKLIEAGFFGHDIESVRHGLEILESVPASEHRRLMEDLRSRCVTRAGQWYGEDGSEYTVNLKAAIAATPIEQETVSPFGCKCWTIQGRAPYLWERETAGGLQNASLDAKYCEMCGAKRVEDNGK